MTAGRQDEFELKKIEEKWVPQTEKIKADKRTIEEQIAKLLNVLYEFSIDFNYEESMQVNTNNNDRKTMVMKNNYFQRFDNALEYFENDPDLPIFQVDIMDITYKFDRNEVNPNLKSNVKNIKEPLLDKYGERDFLQDIKRDPLQKEWYYRPPLLISHMRPVRAEDRDYILVEKQQLGNKIESETAIQKEIQRFKMTQGLQTDDTSDNSANLDSNMKQNQKKQEEQRLLDIRYSEDNPERDSNYAKDAVENYMKSIEEEKKKIKEQRNLANKNNKY